MIDEYSIYKSKIEELEKETQILKEKLEFHELFIENSNSWESFRDKDGKLIHISSNFEQILGYSTNDYLNNKISISEIVYPADKEMMKLFFQKQLDKQAFSNFICRVYHIDKSIKYVSISSKPVYNNKGEYLGFRTTIIDITEQKKIEQSLKENEEKYKAIVDSSLIGISLAKVDTIVYVNSALLKITGYFEKELIGSSFIKYFHQEDVPLVVERINKRIKGEIVDASVRLRLICKNQEIKYIDTASTDVFFNNDRFTQSVVIDVTEKVLAEKALQKSEELYRLLANNVSDVIWILDIETKKTKYVSPSVFDLSGYTVEEALNMKFGESLLPEYKELAIRSITELIDQFSSVQVAPKENFIEVQQIRKDGSIIWIEISTKIVKNDGKLEMYGIVRNITKRKEIEKNLYRSEAQLRLITDNLPAFISYIDKDVKYKFVNKKYCDFLNIERDQATDIDVINVIGKEAYGVSFPYLLKALLGERTVFENKIENNGTTIFTETTLIPHFENSEVKGTYVLALDVTGRKLIEQEIHDYIQELKKLNDDKDRFMTILAHDLKNPFNTLLGFSNLLMDNLHNLDFEKIKFQVGQIQKTSQRTYNLLEDLLIWSNSQSGKIDYIPEEIEFNQVCYEVLSILQPQSKAKSISINYFELENAIFLADKNMIKTILRNLVSNAIKFTYKDGQINIFVKVNKDDVTIIVSDNGIGMDQKYIPKLWEISEQHISTGTAGEKGTGLGLLICKDFVEKHGGKIWVESELGKGCDFKFTIPVFKL